MSVYAILKVNLGGHQWLFSAPVKTDAVPAICLRHDVDGYIWQLESPQENGHWPCTHIGTFPAFGYVQASKQQKKFCTCAPGTSNFCLLSCSLPSSSSVSIFCVYHLATKPPLNCLLINLGYLYYVAIYNDNNSYGS